MPVISDTSQASAARLRECMETMPDNPGPTVVTGNEAGFQVDDELFDCWESKGRGDAEPGLAAADDDEAGYQLPDDDS